MVTRRKIRRRNARKLAAFWKKFEDDVFKRVVTLDHYEVNYVWREPVIYQPPKGRILGVITD